ncbi:MAG: response regulator, partial [Nitrospirae bacterium]|nr:response regulator [Nitrospirota bacterium]
MKTAKKGNKNTSSVLLPRLIIDNVREGIITVDLKGRILFINHSALEMLGGNNAPSNLSRTMKKYRKASLINCLPRGNRKFFKDGVARIKDAHNLKQLILKTDIKGKKIKAVFSHLRNGSDKIIGILISLTNITEDALINERKTNFISDVSHALRTPITAIQGAAELMLKGIGGMPNKKHEEFNQIISKNCKRLNNLINDVVRMAKYESNRVPLNLKKTHLIPIIENHLIKFDKKIKEKAIIVEKTLPSFVNVAMNIDAEKIGEVIAILLTNAIRYTPKNGRIGIDVDVKDSISKGEIESKLYNPDSKQGLAEVSIYNECKGISERDMSRLFDKYEKVKNFKLEGGKPDTDGKVLTLPLARMLVESHDGKIWAESKEGGCSFHFTIPLFKKESVRKEKEPASIVEVLPQTDEIMEIDEWLKALIVNDNPTVFKVYKDALERAGFRIFEGKNEEEAIDLARRHMPSIIIIDVLMPEADSVALVKVLREDPET